MSSPAVAADWSRARDWTVSACCLAASAIADPSLSDGRRAARLMDCLGVLAAVTPPGQVITLGQLRAGLSGPLRDLLPPGIDAGATGDVVLLEPWGSLSAEAEDVAREHFIECAALEQHWTHRRVRAEQEEQQQLYQELRALGNEGYSRARGLLTDHASGEVHFLRNQWDTLWPRFGGYEPVVKWPWAQLDGWWFACPLCKWPMKVTRESGTTKGYVTSLRACPDGTRMTAGFVMGSYHRLSEIEKSFRMSRHDLQTRPIYHRKRDSIEAHLTIVFAALAVSRWIEHQAGWSIRRFVRTARRYRTIEIQAGPRTITAADPPPATSAPPWPRSTTRTQVRTNLIKVGSHK